MGIDSWSESRFASFPGQLSYPNTGAEMPHSAPFFGGILTEAGVGAIVQHGAQFLIVVGVADPDTILALAIRPQTSPLMRQEVRVSRDDACQLGVRRLTSVIATHDRAVVAISRHDRPHVVGDGSWLLSRIETTARRWRETAALERA